ncbi:MAG: DUF2341 domain-containing protein [Myxococcota bacterium]
MHRLPLVALLLGSGLGGGCIVDDPSYLGTATTSNGGSTASSSISGSGMVMSEDPSGSAGSMNAPTTGTGTGIGTDDTTGCVDPSAAWWDARWSHRRRLTFNNLEQAEDLSNFTVLVVLPEDLDDSATAPGGIDLRFVDSDQSAVLDHQIERWPTDSGTPTDEHYVWVEVPQIDGRSMDDHIWLYYGNPMATDTQDPAGSWDDSYVGVWHLEESAGTHQDSATGITCNWEGSGRGSQDAPGWIAGAVDFDGDEDNIDCGVNQIADAEYHTITTWVRLDLIGDNHQQIVNVESTDDPYRGIGLYVRRQSGAIGMWLDSNYHYTMVPENRVTVGEWSFLAIRGRQATSEGYLEVSHNGGPWDTIFEGNTNNLRVENGTSLIIGKWHGPGPSASTQGIIDEVRISNVARSNDWIRAQYLSDTQQLVSIGDTQTLCR